MNNFLKQFLVSLLIITPKIKTINQANKQQTLLQQVKK